MPLIHPPEQKVSPVPLAHCEKSITVDAAYAVFVLGDCSTALEYCEIPAVSARTENTAITRISCRTVGDFLRPFIIMFLLVKAVRLAECQDRLGPKARKYAALVHSHKLLQVFMGS